MTPNNTASKPFVLDVVATAPTPTPPTVTNARQSHQVWREPGPRGKPMRKHEPPVGTAFSFTLNEPAEVRLAFVQTMVGRVVTRGKLKVPGHTGANRVFFDGRISASKELEPGRYTLVITATSAAGQRSRPRSISFTIVK
jgi:hypothetical protein